MTVVRERSDEMIERQARLLYAVYADDEMPKFERLNARERNAWLRLAAAVPGVVHLQEATSGGFATAPQGDAIRELRERVRERTNSDGKEAHSFIGTTRPYGEMVVLFEVPGAIEASAPVVIGFLVHPDGAFEDLHRESVS